MHAIFRGRRYELRRRTLDRVWLARITAHYGGSEPLCLSPDDPHLILEPSDEDLEQARAYERGQLKIFEYVDGRTYPPGHEIGRFRRSA